MSYNLENVSEFDRLEQLSVVRALDPRRELADVDLPPGSRALDAGCGSGFVVRHLGQRFPGSQVLGTDASAPRIEQARRAAEGLPNVAFQVDDLLRPGLEPESFDLVHCRLVMEHLSPEGRAQAARSLYRYLKPGGVLRVASIDGAAINIYPTPPLVAEMVAALRAVPGLDLEVGRKVPSIIAALGVEAFEIRIEADPFTSEEGCRQAIRAAVAGLRAPLLKIVGSEERIAAMVNAYEETMLLPGATAMMNKFIVTCRKPVGAARGA